MKRGDKIEFIRMVRGRGRSTFPPGRVVVCGDEFDVDQCRGLVARGDAKLYQPRTKGAPRNKALAGPTNTKAKGPAPSRLSPFSTDEIVEEIERRTERPFIEGFPVAYLVQEVSKRHGGNGAHAFETDQLLEALHERGAVEKTDEPFETLTVSLPSLAEVQARPKGKFDAFQADLRAVGVKGRSWDELAEDYERWLEGLLAPLGETEDKSEDGEKGDSAPESEPGPPPSPSPAPSEATPPKEDGTPA